MQACMVVCSTPCHAWFVMAYLRIQVADVACGLLVAVVRMLPDEVGAHARRNAATRGTSDRHAGAS